MKIFHTENEKNKVYVQMNDLIYLNETDIPIPASIFIKVFSGITIVTDENRFDFVEFEKQEEIEFFRGLDWIIDYDEYITLSDDELEARAQQICSQMGKIATQFNGMSEEARRNNIHLKQDYELKEYMLLYCSEIYALRNGKVSMPLPNFVPNPYEKPTKRKLFRKPKK